jgi:SpoVK/Ycf46/Vps4 family AAA+-type ATPase
MKDELRFDSKDPVRETNKDAIKDAKIDRVERLEGDRIYTSSAFEFAAPLDLLCARFAFKTILQLGPKFNLRRDINNVVTLGGRYFAWPEPVLIRLRDFLSKRCTDMTAWQDVSKLPLEEFMVRHGSWNGLYDDASLYYFIDEFVKLNSKEILAMFVQTVTLLDSKLAKARIRLIDNIRMLSTVLGLSDAEQSILLHASLCKYQRELRPVLVDCKAASAQEAYAMLGHVLSISAADVGTALKQGGRLEALGLIETPIAEHAITDLGDLMRVSDKLLGVLTTDFPSESSMMAAFTRPASVTALKIEDFPHIESDARYLTALLNSAVSTDNATPEKGINVLLYGPPGTGKTEFAKLVSQLSGLELYEVDCLDKDGNSLSGKERYRSLQVSQAFLKGRPRAAILFDEVEDVFPPISQEVVNLFQGEEGRGGSVNGKAWVNQTLEQNPVPTIWISNAINQIDPAYRRRFQFHLELANPPQRVRENIARKYLASLGVSDEFIGKIAARKAITPAQIQSAARFARLTSKALNEPIETLIHRQLERADKALGNTEDKTGFRVSVTNYDVSLLNIESRYTVERTIEALRAKPKATMCFYGLPGTGKTALAEHIAKSIEKPLLIKRASDLMSKYVGETEQQMAAMFEEAKREGAVLLLDEADSFLQNRQLAVRSYEVSEVNEMLQGMERFDGLFICTTNLFDRIDEAALRRFSFKLKFMALTKEQRETMFVSEALGGDVAGLTPELKTRLAKMEVLCPGDFAAVKRQYVLFDETPVAQTFIEQLEKEHAVKSDVKFNKPMGFTH